MSGVFLMFKEMRRPVGHLCALMVAVAILLSLLIAKFIDVDWALIAVAGCIALVQGVIFWLALRSFIREMTRRALGVRGEWIMATQLAELGRDGHIIVHDLPCANMNIDHVIIGPKGVIVVETKMRAKREGPRSEIRVDSEAIVMNDGPPDPAPIKQLRMAMSLLQDKIQVPSELLLGVIVYPEWWVHDWADHNVRVSNDKRLFTHIHAIPDRMSPQQVSHYFNLIRTIFDAELRASTFPD